MKKIGYVSFGVWILFSLILVSVFVACSNEDQNKASVIEDNSAFEQRDNSENNVFQRIEFNKDDYTDLVVLSSSQEPHYVTFTANDKTGAYNIVTNIGASDKISYISENYMIKPSNGGIEILNNGSVVQEMVRAQ